MPCSCRQTACETSTTPVPSLIAPISASLILPRFDGDDRCARVTLKDLIRVHFAERRALDKAWRGKLQRLT